MRRQLGVGPDSSDDDPIVRRNRANLLAVMGLLRGDQIELPQTASWDCPRPDAAAVAP